MKKDHSLPLTVIKDYICNVDHIPAVKKNQGRIRLKVSLLQKGMTVTALAKQIGCSRPNVSKAINWGQFPRILRKIEEVLS